MPDVPKLMFTATDTISAEDNLFRALATFFLNRGSLDGRLRAAEADWNGKPSSLGSHLVSKLGSQAWQEFLAWQRADPLAEFIADSGGLKRCYDYRNCPEGKLLSDFLAARFKVLTGYEAKRLPKDLRKSFYTKASNRVRKFAEEWVASEALQEKSIRDHLAEACSKKWMQKWKGGMPTPDSLMEINSTYRKYAEIEDLGPVVEELMEMAEVAGVMAG